MKVRQQAFDYGILLFYSWRMQKYYRSGSANSEKTI